MGSCFQDVGHQFLPSLYMYVVLPYQMVKMTLRHVRLQEDLQLPSGPVETLALWETSHHVKIMTTAVLSGSPSQTSGDATWKKRNLTSLQLPSHPIQASAMRTKEPSDDPSLGHHLTVHAQLSWPTSKTVTGNNKIIVLAIKFGRGL